MRLIRKAFIGIGLLIILLIAAAIAIPILFEDDIKARVQQELNASVNADIDFDFENFNLTLFSDFPDVTMEMRDLSVFNRAPFKGNRLFAMEQLGININLYDLLFANRMKIDGITLVRPTIHIKILPNGMASYDIMMPSADTVQQDAGELAAFSFQIDQWRIIEGCLIYDDYAAPMKLVVKGLNHSGSGNFNEKTFDLETHTIVDSIYTSMGKIGYLNNDRIEANLTLGVSEQYTRFEFKENNVRINDLELAFDGWLKMDDESYGMDIRYSTQKNTFKTLLSLVPGIYTQQFKDIDAAGKLALSGFAKGTYSEQSIPAFQLNVAVDDGMFKYPNLSEEVRNINIDLLIDNTSGVLKDTRIDLKKLHLDFGANPCDAQIRIENLHDYNMDAEVKARINLEDIGKILPMEGLSMKGSFAVQAVARGVYDSINRKIPMLDIAMELHDGYVKSNDFPIPLENVAFDAFVKNKSGKMVETTALIKNLAIDMDGEKFTADMMVKNMDDYTWDANAQGTIDLTKVTKIFPIDKMSLSGKIKADIHTTGKMSDVTQKRYDNMPTKGEASLHEFKFAYEEMPYSITVEKARIVFDPLRMQLENMEGKIGQSDFRVSGYMSNYIAYIFGENETVTGKVNISSDRLNINEFMTEGEDEQDTVEATPYSVVPVPDHIYAEVNIAAKNITMMDYKLMNASGAVVVKDRAARFRDLTFDLLDAKFQIAGKYDTKNINSPEYDLDLNIHDLAVDRAFAMSSVVKTYAPFARLAKGNFDVECALRGKLLSDMTLNIATIAGNGRLQSTNVGFKKSKIVNGIMAFTKLGTATNEITLRDIDMRITIDKGRMTVNPFYVQLGDYQTNIKGSMGIDGTMDYLFTINVPADKLGNQLQGFLQQNAGGEVTAIPVTVRASGTYNDPKFVLETREQSKQLQKKVIEVVTEKAKEFIQQTPIGKEGSKIVKDLVNISGLSDTNPKDSAKETKSAEQFLKKGFQGLFKKKKD